MSDAARKLMTPDEFILWNLEQEERWEFVDGRPVLKFDNGPEMMAGASENHDQIVVNLIQALRRLRGGPCRAKTADQAARMERGNIRYPDVTVDCGPRSSRSLESVEPAVFFEVLSPSTRRFDLLKKADEYRRTPTLKHFVFVEPGQAKVMLWSRDADGDWTPSEIAGLDSALDLPAIGVSLPMAEVYEDVELSPEDQLE
jgi:Uma2 family endonuclease